MFLRKSDYGCGGERESIFLFRAHEQDKAYKTKWRGGKGNTCFYLNYRGDALLCQWPKNECYSMLFVKNLSSAGASEVSFLCCKAAKLGRDSRRGTE